MLDPNALLDLPLKFIYCLSVFTTGSEPHRPRAFPCANPRSLAWLALNAVAHVRIVLPLRSTSGHLLLKSLPLFPQLFQGLNLLALLVLGVHESVDFLYGLVQLLL